MKQSNIIRWTLFIASILPVFSCKKYLDMDITDKGRKPVVNALLIADSIPKISVYQSTHILDTSQSPIISNAEVFLTTNFQNTITLYYNNYLQQYVNSSIHLHEGDKIKLNVNTSIGNAEVEVTIPSKIEILNLDTLPHFDNSGNKQGIEIKLSFKDPSTTKDYYILYTQNGSYLNTIGYEGNDPAIEEMNNRLFISDLTFNGKQKNISLIFYNNYDMYPSNMLYIYLMHVDENYYKYVYSVYKQQEGNNSPFSEPVIAYNNIKNGYGIGGAANIYKDSIDISSLSNQIKSTFFVVHQY